MAAVTYTWLLIRSWPSRRVPYEGTIPEAWEELTFFCNRSSFSFRLWSDLGASVHWWSPKGYIWDPLGGLNRQGPGVSRLGRAREARPELGQES